MKINYRYTYSVPGLSEDRRMQLDADDLVDYRIDDIAECESNLEEAFLDYIENEQFLRFYEALSDDEMERCEIVRDFASVSIDYDGKELVRVHTVIVESGEWSDDDLLEYAPESMDSWMRSQVPGWMISA